MKALRFYRTRNGKQPFVLWIESIKDVTALAQVNTRVRRLALGQRGDCKRIGKGIFELRIHYGPGYRVYFAEYKKEVILLLLGGHKNSQDRDIEQAVSYWQDYNQQLHE